MKKRLAALMCIVMLLVLAACNKPADQPSAGATEETVNATGTLLLNMTAVIRIAYDEDGKVLSIAGDNEAGRLMAKRFPEVRGTACTQMVTDLVTTIATVGYDFKQPIIVLKQTQGSQLPSDTFLEEIHSCAKNAAPNHKVFLVAAEALTQEGYLPSSTVLNIIIKQLDLIDPNLIEDPQIVDGQYHFLVDINGSIHEYFADADTGLLKKALPTAEGDDSLEYLEGILPDISVDDPSDLVDDAPDPGPVQNDPDDTAVPTTPTISTTPTTTTE